MFDNNRTLVIAAGGLVLWVAATGVAQTEKGTARAPVRGVPPVGAKEEPPPKPIDPSEASIEHLGVDPVATQSWAEIVQRAETEKSASSSAALPQVVPFLSGPGPQAIPLLSEDVAARNAPDTVIAPGGSQGPPVTVTSCAGATGEPALADNFGGLLDNGTTIPPDTMGAVGPNHIVTMLNSEVLIQTKTGCQISRVSLRTFWTSVATFPFDPKVIYDSLSNRWIAVVDAQPRTSSSRVCIAVSATNDPTGSWTFYFIDVDASDTYWADYPGVGINSTWIAITNNMYRNADNAFSYAKMWVLDKAALLAGGSFTVTVFPQGFDYSGNVYGASLKPCVTHDAGESTVYVVDNTGWTDPNTNKFMIRISRITGSGSSPSWSVQPGSIFSGSGLFTVAYGFHYYSITASQLGTSNRIATGDLRVLNAIYRNGRIWCTHGATLPAYPAPSVNRTSVFWYQLNPGGMPNPIVQSGVLDGGVDVHHFFPSIDVNCGDDACIGFSRSDATRFAEAVYACRTGADALGTMRSIQVLKAGEDTYYKTFGSGQNRWGDYSATCVDPADDRTFWTIQEYAALGVGSGPYDDRWGTWWGKLVPPSSAALEDAENPVVTAAFTDCNNNGTDDGCDIAFGTSEDCNANVIPDECDLAAMTSLDCNENSLPDECDLADHNSQDCNSNGVPDECELECNSNLIPDICDIARGTSIDCNVNGIPDECENPAPNCPDDLLAFDVNSGGVPSTSASYVLVASTGQHGGVGSIASASYELLDGFWHAAALPPPPGNIVWNPATIPGPWPNTNPEATTRSLRFTVTGPGTPTKLDAIKVTMVDLQHPNPRNLPTSPPANYTTFDTRSNGVCTGGQFNGHHCDTDADCVGTTNGTCTPLAACTAAGETNGCARWVGKPGTFYESEGPPQSGPYLAARLQCTPYYWDWKSEGLITVVGAEIVPSSDYSVQAYAASCMGSESTCTNVSAPVTMYTRRLGDVDAPYNPGSTPITNQPNAGDIAQLVNKFKNLAGAPVKARAQLQPNLPELNASINALDIVAVVDAFKGLAYAFSGPCPCPSTQTCGLPCAGCAGMCVKTCTGGANDGKPCIGPAHCPSGACSTTGTCRDRCGRCSP